VWWLCVVAVYGGCVWWLCVVAVCGGCVWWLSVVAVCGVCVWWLCVVAVCGGCAWLLCVVAVCGGCVWCLAMSFVVLCECMDFAFVCDQRSSFTHFPVTTTCTMSDSKQSRGLATTAQLNSGTLDGGLGVESLSASDHESK
jgi:hypothetical protein